MEILASIAPQIWDFAKSYCEPESTVAIIGNFDGCHLGHQQLFSKAFKCKENMKLKTLLLTFTPNPGQFFSQKKLPSLFSQPQKRRYFQEIGIDYYIAQEFDVAFSKVNPSDFYQKFLKKILGIKAIVVGEDFHFAYKRQGNVKWLSAQKDCEIFPITEFYFKQKPLHSTVVRNSLSSGEEFQTVEAMLGRSYLLEGIIISHAKKARELGFATLNLKVDSQIIPANGVYAGYVYLGDEPTVSYVHKDSLSAVLHIGETSNLENETKIEAHVIDKNLSFTENYGKHAGFYLKHFIRNNHKFINSYELKKQINKDILAAKSLL